jgi:ATP-dependent helicase HrpB
VNRTDLPISPYLAQIVEAVARSPVTILQAAPGAGKSTELPLALMESFAKILMLEPRRMAARSLCNYLAERTGSKVGEVVGYRMRGETRVSGETRLEIITEGLLSRMLITDPELPGVELVIFDEFHERNISGDEALALSVQVQRYLRPELRLLIMSATLQAKQLQVLFPEAPLIEIPGRSYPVALSYRGKPERLEVGVSRAVREALRVSAGDVLVFLPGRGEINRCREALWEVADSCRVVSLSADTPAMEMGLLFRPGESRRVILSTSVAETSVTLPGVTAVVDSGLTRYAVFDSSSGMELLVTRKVSAAQAQQRCGRAGRVAPGVCLRLWEEGEQLLPQTEPEILRGDVTSFALNLSLFGVNEPAELLLLDYPPPSRFQEARSLLKRIGALDAAGRALPHAKQLAAFGVHPRMAQLLLKAKALKVPKTGAYLVALLEASKLPSDNLSEAIIGVKNKELLTRAAGLLRQLGEDAEEVFPASVGELVLSAYPERLARRTERGSYILGAGGEVRLQEGSTLAGAEFLTVARVSGSRILCAEPITFEEILRLGTPVEERELVLERGEIPRVVLRQVLFGLVLDTQKKSPTPEERGKLFLAELRKVPLNGELWSRVRFAKACLRYPIEMELDERAIPYLSTLERFSEISHDELLRSMLPFDLLRSLNRELPAVLKLPTGTEVSLEYSEDGEIFASVLIQELFGFKETPRVADSRPVTLELLTPARRPIQTTKDLNNFWKVSYPELVGELRRRYPKHHWPENPLESSPVRKGLKRNLQSDR